MTFSWVYYYSISFSWVFYGSAISIGFYSEWGCYYGSSTAWTIGEGLLILLGGGGGPLFLPALGGGGRFIEY